MLTASFTSRPADIPPPPPPTAVPSRPAGTVIGTAPVISRSAANASHTASASSNATSVSRLPLSRRPATGEVTHLDMLLVLQSIANLTSSTRTSASPTRTAVHTTGNGALSGMHMEGALVGLAAVAAVLGVAL